MPSASERGISQRRGCQLLSVSRSSLGYQSKRACKDKPLLAWMKQLALEHPRYGYRRIWALLRRAGELCNHKRVHRLWKLHGLSLTRKQKRKRRKPPMPRPLTPTRPNQVWAYDFVHDHCENGQALKCLGIVDEYTRECLALEPDTRINAQRVIEILEKTMQHYGTPQYLRSDQGPEFIAEAVQKWLYDHKVDTAYIEPGKPWQNGVNESFFDKLRDECLNLEWFAHLLEARMVLNAFRKHVDFPAERVATRPQVAGIGWSDHWSFWQAGYPAVMVTDTLPFRYKHYHLKSDTADRLDYDGMASVVAGLKGVLLELAGPNTVDSR